MASGRTSPPRVLLCGPSVRAFAQSALVADLELGRSLGDTSVEFHYANGPFTLVPAGDHRANLVWIGSAVAMGLVMASKDGDPKLRGALARRIYTRAAMPAFVVSFVAALLRTGMDLKYYFVQHHWMHGKLLFALAAIAIHHILGARARKMEAGSMQEAGPSAMLTIVFAVSAIIAAFFVILRFPD